MYACFSYNEEEFKDNNAYGRTLIQTNKKILKQENKFKNFEDKLIPIINKKRKREKNEKYINNYNNDSNINDNSKLFENNNNSNSVEFKNINLSNNEYIYLGCEDGNIRLIKISNESITKKLLNKSKY